MIKEQKLKNEMKRQLNNYCCQNKEILEDLPELGTGNFLNVTLEKACEFFQEWLDWYYESEDAEELTDDLILQQISKTVDLVVEYFDLSKKNIEDVDILEDDEEEVEVCEHQLNDMIQRSLEDFLNALIVEVQADRHGFELHSRHYIYVVRRIDTGEFEIHCFNSRCVPDYFEIVKKIVAFNFFDLKNEFQKILKSRFVC